MPAKFSKGLGRGFDALIPKDFDNSLLLDSKDRIKKIPIQELSPASTQPRQDFDEDSIKELSQSIKRYGILQPLVVTPDEHDKYSIIAGERRWRAAQLAGLTEVPAVVRSTKELERLEIALIENVQRVDLSPLEQAASIARLHQQFNMSYSEIAQRLGKASATLSNIVRLLQLPDAAQSALQARHITEGHARAILALKSRTSQLELLDLIQKRRWTVRQAEQFVLAQKRGIKKSAVARQRLAVQTPATMRLSNSLATPVTLRRTARGGKLEIGFTSDEDLERIIKKIQT